MGILEIECDLYTGFGARLYQEHIDSHFFHEVILHIFVHKNVANKSIHVGTGTWTERGKRNFMVVSSSVIFNLVSVVKLSI